MEVRNTMCAWVVRDERLRAARAVPRVPGVRRADGSGLSPALLGWLLRGILLIPRPLHRVLDAVPDATRPILDAAAEAAEEAPPRTASPRLSRLGLGGLAHLHLACRGSLHGRLRRAVPLLRGLLCGLRR
jgi:hypothetical protein